MESLKVPDIHLGYRFITDKLGGECAVVLVGKDCEVLLMLPYVAPFKGGDTGWVSEHLVRGLRKFGWGGGVEIRPAAHINRYHSPIVCVCVCVSYGRGAHPRSVCRESSAVVGIRVEGTQVELGHKTQGQGSLHTSCDAMA